MAPRGRRKIHSSWHWQHGVLAMLALTFAPAPTNGFEFSFRAAESWVMKRVPTVVRRATATNVPAAGFYNPLDAGGSFLTAVAGTYPPAGEPLNVIISGESDADVLVDQQINGGLRNYFLSIGFSSECLGQHSPGLQLANLGDGNPPHNETAVIRWNYGDPELGTCKETIEGGNHFRYWTQNGPNGDSGAIFMAASYELPISQGHNIAPNGYNLGRDEIIGNATNTPIVTANLTANMTFVGTRQAGGYTYQTSVQYVSGLLPNTSDGINHNSTVAVGGANAVDGLVAVLTVEITESPPKNSALRHPWPSLFLLAVIPVFLSCLLSLS